MKAFFRNVLANLTALAIAALTVLGLGLLIIVAVAVFLVGDPDPPVVAKHAALVVDLNMNITEAPFHPGMDVLLRNAMAEESVRSHYLLEIVTAIERSAHDDRIAALFIQGRLPAGSAAVGLGALGEIRNAVVAFRETGKPVYAYSVAPGQRDYYLTSAASYLALHPYAVLPLKGLAVQSVYFGDALEKYGIGVQTLRVGKYKSTVDMFESNHMSAADREQLKALLGSLWENMLADMARGRAQDVETLRQASQTTGIFHAAEALEAGLVDAVCHYDEMIAKVRDEIGPAADETTFQQISLARYIQASGIHMELNRPAGRPAIAVLYADGVLVPGETRTPRVGGDWFARQLRELRHDPDVAGVVVRVNSPGGSVMASEVMQREMVRAAASKPLVVSFGSYGASGGYWISAPADVILVDPGTITGSIGVFGVLFNIENLAQGHGVTFDGVKTGPWADMHTLARPKTEEELERLQELTDFVYQQFLHKVADGRDLDLGVVEDLAQGRLWTGQDAVRLGLADRVGGLRDAVETAAFMADIDPWHLVQIPRPHDWSDVLNKLLKSEDPHLPVAGARDPLARVLDHVRGDIEFASGFSDPHGIYARLPYRLRWGRK